MKKIISAILCALLCMPLSVPISAEEALPEIVIKDINTPEEDAPGDDTPGDDTPEQLPEVGTVSLSEGTYSSRITMFPVTASVSSETELSEITLYIEYPNDISINTVMALKDGNPKIIEIKENGKEYIQFTWTADTENLSGSFDIAKITFDFPLNITEDTEYEIKVNAEGKDKNGKKVSLGDTSAVTKIITATIYGDTNGDGKYNSKDISLMLRRIAGHNVSMDVINADVNLDSKVNSKDISIMLKVLAGWENVRLGHNDISEIITEADCQKNGKVRLTCTVCHDSVVVDIPKTGHNFVLGKCSVCGLKNADYPVIAYNDYLKNNAKFDADLRGYTFYETLQYDGYTAFASNICDSKTGAFCLFCVVNYDSGILTTFSLETTKVKDSYDFYYDCRFDDEVISSANGTVSSSGFEFTKFSGTAAEKESHETLCGKAVEIIEAYTEKLLKASGLDITMEDFNLK